MTFSHALSTNNYGPAKFIVDVSPANGTHTTISAALTSASSGDTIFIRPGTYTEDLTLKDGVSIAAFASSFGTTPPVTILGNATLTSGQCRIDNVTLRTNGAACLTVSGNATVLLFRCQIFSSNNVGISTDSGRVTLFQCNAQDNAGTANFFTCINGSAVILDDCYFTGTGSTANTFSGTSALTIRNSTFQTHITTSDTSPFICYNSQLFSGNRTLTLGGTAENTIYNTIIFGGNQSAISVGAGATLTIGNCVVSSSNANAITGAGTLIYGGITFTGSSNTINTTTQTPIPWPELQGGTGQTAYTTGDILYSSATDTLSKLAAGSDGEVLTLAAGIPSWAPGASGTVTSVSGTADRITSSGGATPVIDIASTYVGQTSITTLGTIATGVWNGTAVDETHGGTDQTTYAAGDILYASASNTLSKLAAGTNGHVLTLATGLPSWAAVASSGFTAVVAQTFTASGTYTPTSGMKYCTIEVCGGGGGGGGSGTVGATEGSAGGGGASGGYAIKTVTAATIGASQTVTIGAAGAGGSAGINAGAAGGTTSVGSIVSATGGNGGGGGPTNGATTIGVGASSVGGNGSSGDLNATGGPGYPGQAYGGTPSFAVSGTGGSSTFGGGGPSVAAGTSSALAGQNAGTYGSGGSGAYSLISQSQQPGGNGSAGIVIITEYI